MAIWETEERPLPASHPLARRAVGVVVMPQTATDPEGFRAAEQIMGCAPLVGSGGMATRPGGEEMAQVQLSELGAPSAIITVVSAAVVAVFAGLTYWGNRRFSRWTRSLREPCPVLVGAYITRPQLETATDALELILHVSNPGTAPLYLRTALVRIYSEIGWATASGLEIKSLGKSTPPLLPVEVPAGQGVSVRLEMTAALRFKTRASVTIDLHYVAGPRAKAVTFRTTLNWHTENSASLDQLETDDACVPRLRSVAQREGGLRRGTRRIPGARRR